MYIPQNILHNRKYAEELFGSFDASKDLILQRGLYDAYDEGSESWIILKDAYFWSARLQLLIHAPAGFITDFASIPRLARPLFTGHGKTRYPAIPHDVLYSYKRAGLCDLSRKEIDLVLKDFCLSRRMSELASSTVYTAVRVGGGFALRNGKGYLSFTTPDVFNKYQNYHSELFEA